MTVDRHIFRHARACSCGARVEGGELELRHTFRPMGHAHVYLDVWRVHCERCGASAAMPSNDAPGAITAWNRDVAARLAAEERRLERAARHPALQGDGFDIGGAA